MNPKDTGTHIPPGGTGTQVPPSGTGTQVPPSGTGTQVPPSGTGTAIPPTGTGTAVPPATGTATGATGRPGPTTGMIPEYDEYIINSRRYTVCKAETARTLSKKSGEAKIFVVENGGRKFVIKLYMPGHSPNHTILDEVQKARGGFMINLHDHGRWTDPRHPGLTLDYEIMDYAPYGSLADLRLGGDEKMFREVAWRMAFCIKQCHEHHILHRDIKPENFLFTDPARKQFVISDFGIARSLTGKGPVKVDTAKSSHFVSPEGSMSSRDRTTYVDCPTDYYSMGMTLLALWIGLDNFYALFPYNQLEELDRLKLNNKVISEISDILQMSAHARSLLERLLEAGDQNRAGFDDIKRWYAGETLKTGSAAEAAVSKNAFHVVFDETRNKVARSREELAAMMMADISFAKSFLYRGMAKNALQNAFPRLAAEIDDIPQRMYPRPDEQATGVYAACLILDPSMPYIDHKGARHTTAGEISAAVWAEKVYYTTHLKKKNHPLWAFLTLRGGEVRADVDRLQQMCARSDIHGVYALCKRLNPSLGFYNDLGKPLKTRKDISAFLWKYSNAFSADLGNPDHMLWTYLKADGTSSGATLARTYPDRIARAGRSELYNLCRELDAEMPFFGKDGKPCVTEKDVADELWDKLDSYRKELADPRHLLWEYMRSWNDSWRKVADSYPSLIASRGDEYIFDLIYRLDSSKPFTVQYADDKTWHAIKRFTDLYPIIYTHGITAFSLETLTRRHFITWLQLNRHEDDRKRGVMLDDLVKRIGTDARHREWYILYTLAPECGLMFEPADAKVQTKTGSDIGYCINAETNGQSSWNVILSDMLDPATWRSSRLAQYLNARKMSGYVDGIAKIIDIQANINAHKSAPYDAAIARWKVIAYLGWNPTYRFAASGKHVGTLSDMERMPLAARNAEADKGLAAWLTIFFHEKKGRPFTFDKLAEYYDYLKKNCPGCSMVQRAAAAEKRNNDAIADRDKAWSSLRRTRMLVMIFCLLPMLVMVGLLVGTAFSDGKAVLEQAFVSVGTVIAWIICVIAALGGLAEGGLIGGIVGGLIGYWVPFWLFGLLSPVAPWLLAALMIGGAAYFAVKLNRKTTDPHIRNRNEYDTLVNQSRMEIVCIAFGTKTRTFGSSTVSPEFAFKASRDKAVSYRKDARKAALGMILMTAVSIGIGVLIAGRVNKIESGATTASAAAVIPASQVPGDYTGTFHGREATMTLSRRADGMYGEFEGSVRIMYSTPMTQQLTGRYTDGALQLNVSGNTSATYAGQLEQAHGKIVYHGTYTNPAKGTSHTFYFTKK